MLDVILQISWFVSYVPRWLGPLLVAVGVTAIVIGSNFEFEVAVQEQRLQPSVGVFLVFLSTVFTLYPWYVQYTDAFMIFIVGAARAIEGAAAVRLYQKLVAVVDQRDIGPLFGDGSRTVYYLAAIFIVLVGGWVVFGLILFGPVGGSIVYEVLFVWTMVTLLLATLGVLWRVWPIRDDIPTLFLFGIVLAFAGAEIHNYAYLLGDIMAYAVGNVGYAGGYIAAGYLWVGSR